MVFSGIPFLFYFLPAVLLLYYLAPRRAKNYILLAAGLVFYFYGEQLLVLLMLATALVDYTVGRLIERFRDKKPMVTRFALAFSLIFDLGVLAYYKYVDFFIDSFNRLFGTALPLWGIALPIGISFYTFQSLSYTIDVYRGERAEKNFFTYATYLTLFPQLVAGPIVRYREVADALNQREHSVSGFAEGALRFAVGLGKKVLIADQLGEFVAGFADLPEKTVYAILFMLQIYYDFSGYSDMAIGLGRFFGFSFPENFNYPYTARSVRDFWRRWHITLSSWFRDYVYIPLGGNRVKLPRWIFNIAVVWFLTGLWHGADVTFILWGLYFALFLVLEKLFLQKWLDKAPKAVGHLYLLLVVLLGFVIFSASDSLGGLSGGLAHIGQMFGFGGLPFVTRQTLFYLRDYALIVVIACVGATPLVRKAVDALVKKRPALSWVKPVAVILLLVLCTAELADAGFHPFLYFNF